MYFNSMLGAGIFLSTLLMVVTFGSPVFASTAANQNNSTRSNNVSADISDVVKLIQSAKNNAGAALSSMEGGTQCGGPCIKVALDKLILIQGQLRLALSILGNTSGAS
jgi:hypothetical protein